uniref:uncharacterized protein n=1 Tax=Myxine glutinosa TaxID=7769 RepID=UPI00358F6BDC
MWSCFIMLVRFFFGNSRNMNVEFENILPVSQVRHGVVWTSKNNEIFGEGPIFGPMKVGELFSLWARFQHAVIVISFTIFIINCLRWISKRVHKHLRKDKEDDREEENGCDSEGDDESESGHCDGESEDDFEDDDESESGHDDGESEDDFEDEGDECDCDGDNTEYWSNIVGWLDFVKRNALNIMTRMTTIWRIEPGVEVQNEVQVVPAELKCEGRSEM